MKKNNTSYKPWARILCIVLACLLGLGSAVAIIIEIAGVHVH